MTDFKKALEGRTIKAVRLDDWFLRITLDNENVLEVHAYGNEFLTHLEVELIEREQ